MRFSFFLCMFFALSLCAKASDYVKDLNADFDELTIASGINVVYKCSTDSAGIAVFSCDPSHASSITFSLDKTKLKIQLVGENIPTEIPTITIYSKALQKATNWGDSTLTIERLNPSAQLKLKIENNGQIIAHDLKVTQFEAAVQAGHGHIHVTGDATEAKYSIRSAGSIEAGSLEAVNVKCNLVGTGSIDCYATGTLTVRGAGSGTVYYTGNPTKVKSQGIGVKIVQM